MTAANLAQLTGQGSFTFKLAGQRFRGQAVPLATYFAWTALNAPIGSPEHAQWYAELLAARHLPGSNPPRIDAGWVLDHVRLQDLEDLDDILLEETPPGAAFGRVRTLDLGVAKFHASSYSLGEYGEYAKLLGEYKQKVPMDLRLEELARALRLRHKSGLRDPALITPDWIAEHLTHPAQTGLETLLLSGRLATDPAPAAKDGERKGKS